METFFKHILMQSVQYLLLISLWSKQCSFIHKTLICSHKTVPFFAFPSNSLHPSIYLPPVSISLLSLNLFLFYKSTPSPIISSSPPHPHPPYSYNEQPPPLCPIWSFCLSISFSFITVCLDSCPLPCQPSVPSVRHCCLS